MRPALRRRMLLLIVLVGLPLCLVAGAWWFVASGQLLARLEAAWDLPGRLRIERVELTGLDSLALHGLSLADEQGRVLVEIDRLEAGEGLWSLAPSRLDISDWSLNLDGDGAAYLRRLVTALEERPGDGEALVLRSLTMGEGRVRLGTSDYRGVSVSWSEETRSFRLAFPDGPMVETRDEDGAVRGHWVSGDLPLGDLVAVASAGGWLTPTASSALAELPPAVDLSGSSVVWRGIDAWDLNLTGAWRLPGPGALTLAVYGREDHLAIHLPRLTDPRLPVSVIDDALSWRGAVLLERLRVLLYDPPAASSGVVAAVLAGSESPLRISWGQIGGGMVTRLEDLALGPEDMRRLSQALDVDVYALAHRLNLSGSTWQRSDGLDAVQLQASWPDGRVDAVWDQDDTGWRGTVRSWDDRRLPAVRISEGRWSLAETLIAESVVVDDKTVHIAWDDGQSLVFEWRYETDFDLKVRSGSVPGDRLVRALRSAGLLPAQPEDLPDWLGPRCELDGSTLAVYPGGEWMATLAIAGEDWQGRASLGSQEGGVVISPLHLDHPQVATLTGLAQYQDGAFQLAWERAVVGPAIRALIPPVVPWDEAFAALGAGRLVFDAAGGLQVEAGDDQGAQLDLQLSTAGALTLTGRRLPATLAGFYLPEAIDIDDGLVGKLTLSYDKESGLDLNGNLEDATVAVGGTRLRELDATVVLSLSPADALSLAVRSPESGLAVDMAIPAPDQPVKLAVRCDDLAVLGSHLPPTVPAMTGAVAAELSWESSEGGLHGRIVQAQVNNWSLDELVRDGVWSLTGVFHVADGGADLDLSGTIDRLTVAVGAGALVLDDLQPSLRCELSVGAEAIQIHGLLLRQRGADGVPLDAGLSLGGTGRIQLPSGEADWSAVLDRLEPAWLQKQDIALPGAELMRISETVSLIQEGRWHPQRGLHLQHRILPLGNDLIFDDAAIEIHGLRGLIEVLVETPATEETHAPTR